MATSSMSATTLSSSLSAPRGSLIASPTCSTPSKSGPELMATALHRHVRSSPTCLQSTRRAPGRPSYCGQQLAATTYFLCSTTASSLHYARALRLLQRSGNFALRAPLPLGMSSRLRPSPWRLRTTLVHRRPCALRRVGCGVGEGSGWVGSCPPRHTHDTRHDHTSCGVDSALPNKIISTCPTCSRH